MNIAVFSIGYATKPIDLFISQLKKYDISAVVDVRSVPFSKRFSDYHQPNIKAVLKLQGIHYIYMGEELGPRSKDDTHYNERHQVQFDRLMKSSLFQKGIQRVKEGVKKGHKIALMCAEKAPLDCHRSLLIGFYLRREESIEVAHILHDGNLMSQQAVEQKMLEDHGMEFDLFMDQSEAIENAWRCQCEDKNYTKPMV